MKVIFMGSPDFAAETLRALIRSDHQVQAVFTQPDKSRGRNKAPTPTPVKEEALRHGIPVYATARIRDQENLEILQRFSPDVIVVAAFGQMIPKQILTLPRWGCINVHASLLPNYRGAAPIQWAIIRGEKESGVTIMQMGEGLDTGDMLARAVVPIAPEETGGSLFEKLSHIGADLLVQTLAELEAGKLCPRKQPEKSPTPYASMLTKEMGRIDWRGDAVSIERLVRGLNPWPSAYSFLNGKQVKIWQAEAVSEAALSEGISLSGAETGQPGSVLEAAKDSFLVRTGDGALRILELQPAGKKRMDAGAFLRGYRLKAGDLLA